MGQRTTDIIYENRAWLASGAMLTFLSSFGQTFFVSVFSGEIQATFELSHSAWGLIYTAGTMASAGVMLFAGLLSDHYRVKALGAVCLAGVAGACLFMAAVPVWWLLPLAIFFLRFFGQGMTSHVATVAMARWFVKTRGRALAAASLGYSVGEAFLPMVFVALITVLPWRSLWVCSAVLCLIAIPLLRRLLVVERTPQSIAQDPQSVGMAGAHWARARALRHPLFWCLVPAILGPSAFVTAVFFQHAFIAEVKGWTHFELVALFPFFTAGGVISLVVTGFLIDRFGTSRLVPFFQLPFALGFFFMSQTTSLSLAGLSLALMGLSAGANATIPPAFLAEFYGTRHLGGLKAVATALMVLGSAIGPGLTGVLIDEGEPKSAQLTGMAIYFLATSVVIAAAVSVFRRDLPATA